MIAASTLETTQVKNDIERWIADTHSLWAQSVGGSWRLLGGYPKNEETAPCLKQILERDWGITDLEGGMREVRALISEHTHHNPARDAWDYCRATQLLCMFYIVGILGRDEMLSECCTVGKVMQSHYHSWEELCASYLNGYEVWVRREFRPEEAEQLISKRRSLFESFCQQEDGPYRVPWTLDLKITPNQSAGYFDQWVKREEGWMNGHRKRTMRNQLFIAAPFTVLILALLGAGLSATSHPQAPNLSALALQGAMAGAAAGLVIMVIVLLALLAGLRAGRMRSAIEKAVKELGMDEREREQLGLEMLDALQRPNQMLEFKMKGPGSNNTPARLLTAPQYLYLCGSSPLVILVRRADVEHEEAGQEEKLVTVRRGNTLRNIKVNLYTIYFYHRSSRERRLEGSGLADSAMGFFDRGIRDRAFAMIEQEKSGVMR